ncbi:hypothetical protein G3576_08190 [Roseomonas stagni]|uniref:Uncharacterized protein n=1 Tax=Falsiroseomonas algicola TaxID=2716930 RepID=A0A6M1LIA7_9PROT|nr:hypothetical protein [Falsiroseomonas algicola]NGM19991.1 hypothetical protein [Falsiroseomonas algicola]
MIRLAILLVLLASPAAAQSRDWTAEKCSRYGEMWPQALARFGRVGLSEEFLARHEAFIASGCRTRDVCPRSPQEIAMADVMTIAAMNAGTASSFVPFICRD